MALAQWHETIHTFEHFTIDIASNIRVFNFLLWQCQLQCKQSCQKLVHCHAHAELFCSMSPYGEKTASNCNRFVLQFQPKFYAVYTYFMARGVSNCNFCCWTFCNLLLYIKVAICLEFPRHVQKFGFKICVQK